MGSKCAATYQTPDGILSTRVVKGRIVIHLTGLNHWVYGEYW